MKKSTSIIDEQGLRLNVGIILSNREGRLFWGRRADKSDAWQFPQGGILPDETPEEAMYRELQEELGLKPSDVEIVSVSKHWFHYYLPKHLRRYHSKPFCIGQKQKWFLLRLLGNDDCIHLDSTSSPEFNRWLWVEYWQPAKEIVIFKRLVYKKVLKEFFPHLKPNKPYHSS